ncbi:hypothetical protein [Natronorubrum daqingense]|uniref:Uncharacterized protein n=1 Tax=Natronorubrum daqingense TaxID=588898 RepID=A0A1N7G6G7_9EURY|nr:hypothetical protein [Natronorubrum daqingense]APX98695.1 hypothetical protein BB347_18485 [Natronorubrum daqingense]SIS08094.1 hypothetical protein SAMN05421809_3764 [Natronorubrum daqingense]
MKRTLILAGIIVFALVVVVGLSAADSEIYAVDDSHTLDDDRQIEEFETDGHTTGEADDLDLEMTISEDSEHVSTDPMTDIGTTYIELDYQEDIDRTIRFYVPQEYFHPYEDQSLSVDGDATAEMEPVEGGEYTAVTVHTEGEGTYVLETSSVESSLWDHRNSAYDWMDDATGYEVPRFAGSGDGEEWEYVESREFAGDDTVSVDVNATVQHDAGESNNETSWVHTPECSGSGEAMCTLEQGDEQLIMTDNHTNETAQVRYKTDTSLTDNLRAGLNEVRSDIDAWISNVQNALSEVV